MFLNFCINRPNLSDSISLHATVSSVTNTTSELQSGTLVLYMCIIVQEVKGLRFQSIER